MPGAYLVQPGAGVEGLELETGVRTTVGQRVQEVVQPVAEGGVDADAEGGLTLRGQAPGLGREGIQRPEHFAPLGQQGLAGRGEGYGTAGAVEQLSAQLPLQ